MYVKSRTPGLTHRPVPVAPHQNRPTERGGWDRCGTGRLWVTARVPGGRTEGDSHRTPALTPERAAQRPDPPSGEPGVPAHGPHGVGTHPHHPRPHGRAPGPAARGAGPGAAPEAAGAARSTAGRGGAASVALGRAGWAAPQRPRLIRRRRQGMDEGTCGGQRRRAAQVSAGRRGGAGGCVGWAPSRLCRSCSRRPHRGGAGTLQPRSFPRSPRPPSRLCARSPAPGHRGGCGRWRGDPEGHGQLLPGKRRARSAAAAPGRGAPGRVRPQPPRGGGGCGASPSGAPGWPRPAGETLPRALGSPGWKSLGFRCRPMGAGAAAVVPESLRPRQGPGSPAEPGGAPRSGAGQTAPRCARLDRVQGGGGRAKSLTELQTLIIPKTFCSICR